MRRLAAGVWRLRPPETAWGRARSRREEGLRTPPPPRPRQHRRRHPRLPSRGSRRCMIWTPSGTRASTSPSTALPTPPSSAPWRASSSSVRKPAWLLIALNFLRSGSGLLGVLVGSIVGLGLVRCRMLVLHFDRPYPMWDKPSWLIDTIALHIMYGLIASWYSRAIISWLCAIPCDYHVTFYFRELSCGFICK